MKLKLTKPRGMDRKAAIRERTMIVWSHGQQIDAPADETPWRYVPRGYGDEGGRWGVYDMLLKAWVADDALLKLSPKHLAEAKVTH